MLQVQQAKTVQLLEQQNWSTTRTVHQDRSALLSFTLEPRTFVKGTAEAAKGSVDDAAGTVKETVVGTQQGMDSDSCILSDMPRNPFVTMRERELDDMYDATFVEASNVIVNLRSFTQTHPGNPGNPATDHEYEVDVLWLYPTEDDKKRPMRAFSTDLEWLYLPAFHRPEVLEWTREIVASGEIYKSTLGRCPTAHDCGLQILQLEFRDTHFQLSLLPLDVGPVCSVRPKRRHSRPSR